MALTIRGKEAYMKGRLIREVITDACVYGVEPLEDFIRRAAAIEDTMAASTVGFALEIIQDVPRLLEEVREQAEIRGVGLLVQPLLEHAEDYFLNPMDHAPEAAFGLTGLLDDAYLSLRLIDLVQQVLPLPAVNVEIRLEFLRQLLGRELVARLDAEAGQALLKLATRVGALREEAGQPELAPAPPVA